MCRRLVTLLAGLLQIWQTGPTTGSVKLQVEEEYVIMIVISARRCRTIQ